MSRIWPIVLTVVVFVVIFLRIPFERFVAALAGARLVPFLALMAGFSLFYFALDTFILVKLLRWFHGPLAYRDLLPARASTYLVSLVNTQLGQGALALYLHRRFRAPLGEITGTIAVLILLEVTQLVLFATAGMAAELGRVPRELWLAPAALLAVWASLALALRAPLASPPAWLAALRDSSLVRTFRRARPGQLLTILALKAPIFLAAVLVHRLALTLFDIHIPALRLLTFLPIVFLVAALPITVAHLGTSQAAWIFFFGDRAAEADLLAYSLASHLTFMLANGALGLLFLPRAYAELFRERATEATAPEPGSS
ncbi:MAG: flippase-like domain-containing protein [Deltaproteobacteria bacterium]|nr:flippase-like domain-containing protein [Deltaproteobacteria bacterium]